MNVRALLRRLWPQRVRTRLTLMYALLFFAAGAALLGLDHAGAPVAAEERLRAAYLSQPA